MARERKRERYEQRQLHAQLNKPHRGRDASKLVRRKEARECVKNATDAPWRKMDVSVNILKKKKSKTKLLKKCPKAKCALR